MTGPHAIPAEELERMSPDERSRILQERSRATLEDLDPEFRARAEATGRRLLEERGLLDTDRR